MLFNSLPEAYRQWVPFAGIASGILLLVGMAHLASPPEQELVVSVAMIGNSIQYYNDLPRLLEAMADGRLKQNSCLHGNSNLATLLTKGSGMYEKWQTGQAVLKMEDQDYDYEVYDYGACTPQQLLFGTDERLEDLYGRRRRRLEQNYSFEDYSYGYEILDDGTNPCLQDADYYYYLESQYEENGPPQWDYILINDNSRNPCCTEQREIGLDRLENVYIPWFQATNATPIFLATYPYWASHRDMSGLTDIPTFASLTYEGYREYMNIVAQALPESQKPRLAPVGFGLMIVWEENPSLWEDLMHYDEVHLSPSGSFLQGCIVYATIFGKLPPADVVFGGEGGTSHLWSRARRMQPPEDAMKPFPTLSVAQYLYHVAHRVMNGEVPKLLTRYYHNESAYFAPDDSLYQ
jgi:hypothetical protein